MPTFKHPCPHCGTYIVRDAAACPKCGTKDPFAPARCGSCRTVIEDPTYVACPRCGKPVGAAAVAAAEAEARAKAEAQGGGQPAAPAQAPRAPIAPPVAPPVASPVAPPISAATGAAASCAACGSPLAAGPASAATAARPSAPRRDGAARPAGSSRAVGPSELRTPSCRSCRRSARPRRGRCRTGAHLFWPVRGAAVRAELLRPDRLVAVRADRSARAEVSPENTVSDCIASRIWLISTCERSASISAARFGAQPTHRPRAAVPAGLVHPVVAAGAALEVAHQLAGGLLEGLVARAAVREVLDAVGGVRRAVEEAAEEVRGAGEQGVGGAHVRADELAAVAGAADVALELELVAVLVGEIGEVVRERREAGHRSLPWSMCPRPRRGGRR